MFCVPGGNRRCRDWRSTRGLPITVAFAEQHQSYSLKIKLPDPWSSSVGMGGPVHKDWPKPRICLFFRLASHGFQNLPLFCTGWLQQSIASMQCHTWCICDLSWTHLLLLPISESIHTMLANHRKLSYPRTSDPAHQTMDLIWKDLSGP